MSEEIELLRQLKTQLVNFLDELIDTFPNEPDFVIYRIFIKDQIPIVDIMNYIRFNLCPLSEMVRNRDENFFINYDVLFEKMRDEKKGKVNKFKKLWTSGEIAKDDKETIWRWFAAFIFLGNKYNELMNTGGNTEQKK